MSVLVYSICPYTPGFTSVAALFADLQENRLVGRLRMDLSVPFSTTILIFPLLALYVVLKGVNPPTP